MSCMTGFKAGGTAGFLEFRPGMDFDSFRGYFIGKGTGQPAPFGSRPAPDTSIDEKESTTMEFLTGVNPKEDLEISEILAGDYEGKNIKVRGAIHTIRDMGDVAFLVLRKREGLVQCVYEQDKS